MLNIENKDRPSFVLFPFNSNRTAWRPIGFPVVLVVPFGLYPDGTFNNDSQVFFSDNNAIKISIEGAPERAKVAGHTNVGKYVPSNNIYETYITYEQLYDNRIIPSLYPLYDSMGEITTDFSQAKYFEYTTGSGSTEKIEYLANTTYYDLSEYSIPTEDLPNGDYYFNYESNYYIRQIQNNELICIDTNSIGLALQRIPISHPGDVMQEFYNLTPEPYLTTTSKAQDSTISVYRPFTDILQDIFDEQSQLENINWVYECHPQIIPYLSTMLGWEIPYFPSSLDNLRKALLRRTVEFQNLKGSSLVISELFRLFGYKIYLDNLWYSEDGKILIAPNEKLPNPYKSQQITSTEEYYTDVAFSNYNATGFISVQVPLLYKPEVLRDLPILYINTPAPITLYAIITNDATTITNLTNLLSNPISEYNEYQAGVILPAQLASIDPIAVSSSILVIDENDVITEASQYGTRPPLNPDTIKIDRNSNNITYSINTSLYGEEKLFVFAVYNRIILNIPENITNLRSNRFTIKIFNEYNESVDQTTLDFLLEFLYRIKAFHSLLYSVKNLVNLSESYLVTDMCVGGDFSQRYGTDLGVQQVPPAILPNIDEQCKTPAQYGFKESDLRYRKEVFDDVLNEFEIAKSYDNRIYEPFDTLIPPPIPANLVTCLYTPYNQDRILVDSKLDEYTLKFDPNSFYNQLAGGINKYQWSPIKATGEGSESKNNNGKIYQLGELLTTTNGQTFCQTDGFTDHCYKGRVSDEIFNQQTLSFSETYVSKPCIISLGTGCYYLFPNPTRINKAGTKNPIRSLTTKLSFTGNGPDGGLQYYKSTIDNTSAGSFLGRLTHNYTANGQTLHYTDRAKIYADQYQMLALQRPEIHIDKPVLHLPGCRLPTIANLADDYEVSFYDARPWDDAWSTYCGPISVCNRGPSFLNAQLLLAEDGNEYLIYDYRDYISYANGALADIGDLGSNTSYIDDNSIIHRIYSDGIDTNPAVTFESLDPITGAILEENGGYLLQEDGSKLLLEGSEATIITDLPRFSSARLCSDGFYHDDSDGYPSLYGQFSYINQDITRSGLYEDVLTGLGWSTAGQIPINLRYYLSSGVFVEDGLRLDCGCSIYSCDITFTGLTGSTSMTDLTSYTAEDQGQSLCALATPNQMDEYQLDSFVTLEESINGEEIRLDGTIPSLFELLPS